MNSLQEATQFIESKLAGRYITNDSIEPLLKKLNSLFTVNIIGQSVLKKSIYTIKFGTGSTKILIWSQMHGNESTTTKALFDFINYLSHKNKSAQYIHQNFTIMCIPILNPDGASAYTRVNANEIDLNRDALAITQPESKILRNQIEAFKPDYCFNLHDQRTIFGVLETKLPATTAFLAPSYDDSLNYNKTRLKAVSVINSINNELQKHIKGQVSRFDDAFNINCIGDYCTHLGIPTILFEAGHYFQDYNREEVRKYIFIALKTALKTALETILTDNTMTKESILSDYLKIPQNNKCFYDIIVKNVKILDNSEEKIINFAAQYVEVLDKNMISFVAVIAETTNLNTVFGHLEVDASKNKISYSSDDFEIGKSLSIFIDKSFHFINGIKQL